MRVDLTVLAIPAYVGAMGAELAWLRAHLAPAGTRAGEYQLADTMASLTMGLGSLIAPHVTKRLLDPVTPTVGRYGKGLLGAAVAFSAATAVGDVLRRRARGPLPEAGTIPRPAIPGPSAAAATGAVRPARDGQHRSPWQRVHGATAVAAAGSTLVTVATTWAAQTSGAVLFARSRRDLGAGAVATAVAILGWDVIYYWNHRMAHESRWMWAMHVVHHSSEHYNLSTALRQPVADGLTLSVPYGLLALVGVRPSVIETARGVNLIYQFWIHTEAIRSIGRLEKVLNSPSHHRVHHGSNREYLDRNHGSILIIWDRLFGTFEPEGDRVRYGLTRNIETHNPLRIASHEWRDIARDIAGATSWRERLSYVLRGPGWSYARRA